jgi:hypothetical protein
MKRCQIPGDDQFICFGNQQDYMEEGDADYGIDNQPTDLEFCSDDNNQKSLTQTMINPMILTGDSVLVQKRIYTQILPQTAQHWILCTILQLLIHHYIQSLKQPNHLILMLIYQLVSVFKWNSPIIAHDMDRLEYSRQDY